MARRINLGTALLRITLGLAAAGASLAVARPAHAESSTHLALDLDFNSAVDVNGVKAGGGGGLRVGQKLGLVVLSLTPELGGSYHAFGGDAQAKLYDGFVGARLGVGKVVEPSIFAHVGYAHLDARGSRGGMLLDGGLALDFTLLPLVEFGLHGGYNVMTAGSDSAALKFLTLGLQAALVF
jgi:hypothetical protein